LRHFSFLLACFILLVSAGCSHRVLVVKTAPPESNRNRPVKYTNEDIEISTRHLVKAKEYYHKGHLKQAQHHCELAIKFNHANWEAHYYLGLTMQKKREYAQSIEALKIGLKLGPDDKYVKSDIHFYLALSFEGMGQSERALAEFNQALVFNSGNQMAREGMNRLKDKKTTKKGNNGANKKKNKS